MYCNTCRGVNAAVSKVQWFCDWNQRGYINVSIHNSSYYYIENVFLADNSRSQRWAFWFGYAEGVDDLALAGSPL